jgi:dipeptidyl aminopeptidase/acylaminoacyl peptidase
MQARRYNASLAVSLQMASDVQLSPDGSRVAFNVAPIGHEETTPASHIWLADVNGRINARKFTSGHSNNTSPRWSPDGSAIAFLSDRASRGTAQPYVIDADGGEAQQAGTVARGLDLIAWKPDGSRITGTADRRALAGEQPTKSDVTVASLSARPRVIVLIDPGQGAPMSVVGPAAGHVWAYAWRPDGGMIAALVTPTNLLDDTEQVSLVLLDPITRAERVLTTFHRQPEALCWSPDGSRLSVVGQTGRRRDDQAVMVIDAASGDVKPFYAGQSTPIWAGWIDSSTLIIAVQDNLWARVDRVDLERNETAPVDLLPEGGSIQAPLGLSADGASIGVVRTNPYSPPEIWAGALDGGQIARLSHLNPQLDEVELATMEPIHWQSSDGMQIDGWLLTPPGVGKDERLPLIADVHGGPSAVWGATFHATWHDWGQLLAAEGYLVLLPNPRGSTGKGSDFTAANYNDLGGMDFEDVMAGIDYLVIERGVADPERLGIAGWSYGGFLTAWAISHSDRFKAAVCGAAVTNWPSKVGTTDIRPFNEERFAGPLHQEPDVFWERSPVRYLGDIRTPTLVVHGEADPRVPVSQGMELYLGLRAMGVPTDFITYPRQKHAFHEKAHQRDIIGRITGWFREHLKA